MKTLPLALLLVSACGPPERGHVLYRGTAMGSKLEIEVYGPDGETCRRAVDAAREEIARLERMMTDWKEESPLMAVNRAAGLRPVEVPPELFFTIRKSLETSELTEGAFDITFAGAGRLWNWRAPDPKVPDAETVRAALENVGWRHVVLDEKARTVFLAKPGMRIGLGAIGPGVAGDAAMARVKALGIVDACVNLSGDVIVSGTKDGQPWRLAVAHPRRKGETLALIPLSNAAISTSGDYERFFEKDGKRYGHIIDPRTGWPADLCQSVTVVTPVLAAADALATGIFVLGPEKGLALAERLEGVEALVVAADGSVRATRGLAGVR